MLYIGVTNDLKRRVFEHQKKLIPGFSARYNVRKLVYFELFGNVHAAIAREKELKGWLRWPVILSVAKNLSERRTMLLKRREILRPTKRDSE